MIALENVVMLSSKVDREAYPKSPSLSRSECILVTGHSGSGQDHPAWRSRHSQQSMGKKLTVGKAGAL